MLNWSHKFIKALDVEYPNQCNCFVNLCGISGNYLKNKIEIKIHFSIRQKVDNMYKYVLVIRQGIQDEFDNSGYPIYVRDDFISLEEAKEHAENKLQEFKDTIIKNINQIK